MHPSASEKDEISAFQLQGSNDSFVSRSSDIFAGLSDLEDKHYAVIKARSRSRSNDDDRLLDDQIDNHDDRPIDDQIDDHDDRPIDDQIDDHDDRPIDDQIDDKVDKSTASNSSNTHMHSHHSRSQSDSRSCSDGEKRRPNNASLDRDGEQSRNRVRDFQPPRHRPPRSRKRYVPDFKLHPEKWTHHSLNDISDEDMSERSNARAALAFLEERQRERERQERITAGLPADEPKFDAGDAACSQGRITFSKPKTKDKTSKDQDGSNETHTVSKSVEKGADLVLNTNELVDNDGASDKEGQKQMAREDGSESKETFKVKKRVKRHIRKKDTDDGSD